MGRSGSGRSGFKWFDWFHCRAIWFGKVAQYDSGFHMLMRDLNADRVLRDITAWVTNPDDALPSGSERPLAVADASTVPKIGMKEGDGAEARLAVHCAGSKQAKRP